MHRSAEVTKKRGDPVKKRIVSILLAAVMLLSAVPLGMVDTAWAISSRDTVVDSGTCGGTLNNSQLMKWTLTSDGTLTISGEGNMFGAPWSQYKSKIKKVVIGEGVKSISDNAFHYYENLRSVSLPSTLTSIGEAAFWACSSLQSITLPNNLTHIGLNAFRTCHSLTQVLIPASVTNIDGSAFECCTGLTDVVFEGNSLEFGSGATFYDCTSLKNVFFNGTRADWTASRGSSGSVLPAAAQIYYKNDLISSGTCGDNSSGNNTQWKLTKAGTLIITVGTGYTEGGIADFAYGKAPWYQDIYDSGIRCLIIGSGIKTIGSYAFADCTDLAEIIVPDGVISIGDGAFQQNSGAKRVVLPPSTVYIGHGALRDCSALTSVSLPDSMSNRLFLDMFEGCTNLKSVDIPDGITDIYEGDLASCPNWTDIYYDNWGRVWNRVVSNVRDSIPDRMNVHFKDNIYDSGSCGENVTWTLTADGTLTISGTGAMTDYTYDSRSPWYSCRTYIKRVVMQQGVTSIGDHAFWDCSGLTSVTIPDSVTSIGGSAFSGCSGLTSVTIPDSVTNVGQYAFDNCSSLTDIYYGGYGTDWQKLNVSIPTSATVHFKDNIYGKGDCGINVTWELTGDGTLIISGTGRISNYSHDNNAPWYSCWAYIKRVVIQQGIRAIGDYAFYYCENLTSVTIPDSVTSIGDYAFAYCVSLTSATIPEGVTSIGGDAFLGCTGLTSVAIPSSVTSTGFETFSGCTGLTSITIPEGVTSIGNYAFKGCSGLTSVTIPDSVTSIGGSAFSGCSGLTSVTIPSSVTSIGWSAFENCTALTFMTIPESVTYISGEVFSNCIRLAKVTIPKSVTSIGKNAFYYCESIADVYYDGTEEDWAKISISEGNEDLLAAALHCKPTPLTAPSVTGGNDSQGRPTLKWDKVAGAAKYEVYRSYSQNGNYSKYSTQTSTGYTNSSYLTSGSTYYYKVRALDTNGTAGAWSSVVSVTYKQTLPAPSVTGGNDSQGRPTLKWNAVTGAAKYEVYRARSKSGDYIKYSTVTGTSYTNTSYIEDGNTYYYKVRALKSDGTAGAWSSIVAVTYKQTLSAPTVTGGNDAQGRPTLKWNAVTGAAKYEVYRARSMNGDYIKYSTVTGTSYTNTSYIADGNTYYYKVRALGASGTAGAWSSIVSVTYRAASTGTLSAPTVTGGNDSQGRPTLKWNAVSGAAKYEVYRARSKNGDYIKYSTVTGTSYTNISCIENGNTYYYKVRALKSDGTAGTWSSIVSVTYRKPAAATVASGKCGDSAKWTLDAAGTLTISGSGKTWDFIDEDWNANAPWYDASLRLRIKKVVVEKGITYVGTWAFYDCSEMTSVSLPTTLQTMGASVFKDCTSLTSVTIPDGVTFISGDFFRGCTSLKSVTLPDSLRETGGCTFMYCTSLTSVRLPATLLSISWQMFKDCKSLTSLTIPRSVVNVMQDAFSGCTALKNVTYTGTAADWKALTIYSGNEALTRANVRCTGSTVLTAPTLTLSVSKKGQPTLKWNAVSGAAGYQIWCSYDSGDRTGPWYHWLTNLDKGTASFTDDRELEKGRTYTYKVRAYTASGSMGTFSNEVTITYQPKQTLPAPTVTGGLDDQGYPALTWPAVPDAARYEVYRAASEDGNFAQLAAVTSNSYTNSAVLTDGAAYYYKVRALDSDGEAGPFSDVVSVTYTARPATVASGKCGDSASWKLDADGVLTITGVGPMADYGAYGPWYIAHLTDIKKVVVQEGVTTIGDHAFANLSYVTSVTIPSSITSIGAHAFEKCRLGGAVTLPEGLTTIGNSAFSGSYMDSLTLPESLRTIGGAAFEKSHLKTLTIPGGVTSIGNGAFKSSHLTSIQLPDGAQLGAMLFYQCYELTDVTLPADLTVIGDSMFENCTKLTHVTIPSGVTRIEREAFTMCGALEEIRLPEGVETIGVIAFSGCVAMTGAYLPRSLTTIESGAFSACRSLTDVYYGGTAAEWAAISVADRNDPLLNAALHCTGQSASRLDVPAMTLGEDCSDGKPTVWWPAVTGAERYEIWRAQAASDGSAPAASAYTLIVSADVTFHKDTTAEADTWYYYKVRAVSGSTYSDFSQAARRYCEAPPTMDTPEITSLELDDSGKPVLTWRTVEGAARYQVFRSEDNGFSYSPMGTVLPTGSDTITWTDTTAVSGTGYYYGVGCYDDNGHYSSFGGGEWWVTAR